MITPPYPVIINEPGFVLLVRCPGGKADSNGVGVDDVIELSAEVLFLTSPPRDEDEDKTSFVTFLLQHPVPLQAETPIPRLPFNLIDPRNPLPLALVFKSAFNF